jgi:CubicO group peptidase (beta-lactamase class C family)
MTDSYFFVPEEKKVRVAKLYTESDGRLVETKRAFGSTLPLGGGGLYTTADDYARFAQMLLDGGQLNGKRILARKTVELMFADSIPDVPRGVPLLEHGYGFGLGGSVRTDLGKSARLGSVGDFGWMGSTATWYRIDPRERTVALLLLQHQNSTGVEIRRFSRLFYQALN